MVFPHLPLRQVNPRNDAAQITHCYKVGLSPDRQSQATYNSAQCRSTEAQHQINNSVTANTRCQSTYNHRSSERSNNKLVDMFHEHNKNVHSRRQRTLSLVAIKKTQYATLMATVTKILGAHAQFRTFIRTVHNLK